MKTSLKIILILHFWESHTCMQYNVIITFPIFHSKSPAQTLPPTYPTIYPPPNILHLAPDWIWLLLSICGHPLEQGQRRFFYFLLIIWRANCLWQVLCLWYLLNMNVVLREKIYAFWETMNHAFQSEEEGGKKVQLGWGEEMKGA